jgi:TolB-like protein
VLAFRNLSGDPDREYFADGVVEDIVTTLSRIRSLVVIPRNSSYLYKDRSVDVRQVGGELGARYVLDGSIRISGSTLRISCVLIDATSGKQIWAERYDGAMEDVFDLQDKITSSIVATIGSKVLRAEITRAQTKPTDNLSAYDLYLRALAGISPSRTESSVNQAVELLQRAIAADQSFSSAYGLLALAHCARLAHRWSSIEEAKTHGLAAAKEAVELGNDDPIALYSGGFGIAYLGGQLEEGLAHIERALTLNPNQLGAWRFGGKVCSMMGDHEKSIQYYERAMQLSPQDFWAFEAYAGISAPHFFLGRYDQALYWADRALRERPSERLALLMKIAALAMKGSRLEEPRNIVQQIRHFSIARIMQRLVLSRSRRDCELLETALRKAGFPD